MKPRNLYVEASRPPGFDLSREYEEAKSLFGPLGEGAP